MCCFYFQNINCISFLCLSSLLPPLKPLLSEFLATLAWNAVLMPLLFLCIHSGPLQIITHSTLWNALQWFPFAPRIMSKLLSKLQKAPCVIYLQPIFLASFELFFPTPLIFTYPGLSSVPLRSQAPSHQGGLYVPGILHPASSPGKFLLSFRSQFKYFLMKASLKP